MDGELIFEQGTDPEIQSIIEKMFEDTEFSKKIDESLAYFAAGGGGIDYADWKAKRLDNH